MGRIAIAVHGGAGTILRTHLSPEAEKQYRDALAEATAAGYNILEHGGKAIDAVESALRILEDNPLFNAGRGAVFNHQGEHELDASIMDGKTLKAGAIAGVRFVKNPVTLARAVMETTPHVMLIGLGAEEFAVEMKVPMETKEYFYTDQRYQQWIEVRDTAKVKLDHTESTKYGTAGVVALDRLGDLAAATSTGGMTNKQFGRVGDTPIIGSGTYANNRTCAISCTGHGEFFIRSVVAHDISCLMEYKGLSLLEACREVVHGKLVTLGGEGGVIAIDSHGEVALIFNSTGMYRGWQKEGESLQTGIFD